MTLKQPLFQIRLLLFLALLLTLSACTVLPQPSQGKHLFILSGQSNMERLDPHVSLIPALEKEFGTNNIIIVKDAMSAQPMYKWYKKWKTVQGKTMADTGSLYDRLIMKVASATNDVPIKTVTFIWMQGEADAALGYGANYKVSLYGLMNQLETDLHRNDINFVIGRISDFDMSATHYIHWKIIRRVQKEVAESNDRFALVNTDDLNDDIQEEGRKPQNDLHYSERGYKMLGERFAEQAIQLIKSHEK